MKPNNSSESTKPLQESAILECLGCFSHRAKILNTRPAKVRCADCGNTYNIRYEEAGASLGYTDNDVEQQEQAEPKAKNRKTKIAYRNEIEPAKRPHPPFLTKRIDDALAAGPAGVRQEQRIAMQHAKRYMAQIEDYYTRDTAFLRDLDDHENPKSRASARYARRWRPRYLAAYSLTAADSIAARYARVDRKTVYDHRQGDQEFAQLVKEAYDHAIDLLEARTFQRALEGDLEPVYYMGVPVDYIRKFSDKLQIELLRAHRPDRFKTPGANVNIGTKGDVFVFTEEQRHELIEINRKKLDRMNAELDAASQLVTPERQRLTNGNSASHEPAEVGGATLGLPA